MQLLDNLPKDGEKIIGFASSPQKWWKRILKEAEIFNFRFHDLRHTFGSQMVSNGFTLEEVAGLLGHSDTSTTKRYSHLMADKNQENAQKTSDNISKMIMGGTK
jgi:integrase